MKSIMIIGWMMKIKTLVGMVQVSVANDACISRIVGYDGGIKYQW